MSLQCSLDLIVSRASNSSYYPDGNKPNTKKLTASSKAHEQIENAYFTNMLILSLSEHVTQSWSIQNQTEVQSPLHEWGKWQYHWGIASLYQGEMLHTEKRDYKGKKLGSIRVLFIFFITCFERR